MNKDIFDMTPEAEQTPVDLTPSADDDFDAELLALLGDDLFDEIVSRKSAPARKEVPAEKPPVKKAPAKKPAAVKQAPVAQESPAKKPAPKKRPAPVAEAPEAPAKKQKKAAPAPEAEVPAKKQKKGPRLGSVIFYTIYFLFILLFVLAIYLGLSRIRDWLASYEAAQPTYKAQQVFDQLFTDPDWGALYVSAGAKDSAYEGKDQYVAYMEEKVGDSKLTYMETAGGLSGKKYIVRLGDEKVASFSLVDKKNVSVSLNLTDLGSLGEIPDWQLGSVEVFFQRIGSYRIVKLDGHTAYVNGVALDESFTIMEATTIAEQYLPEGLTGVSMCTQEVNGLMEKPEVIVNDENGNPVEVTYDEQTRTFTARTESNTMAEDQETVALEAAKINALWMIEEVKDRGKVAKYYDASSKPYDDIVHLGELWMQGNAGYEFKNEKVSNFAAYGSDMFSVYVSLDLDVTRKDGTSRTYDFAKTLFFKKISGSWKVVEWTNVDVSQPVGKVRLSFLHNGSLLNSEFYETDADEIITPIISPAPEGKTFSGWATQTVNEEGNTVMTIVFQPDETGTVAIPDGTTLEPMMLYSVFE